MFKSGLGTQEIQNQLGKVCNTEYSAKTQVINMAVNDIIDISYKTAEIAHIKCHIKPHHRKKSQRKHKIYDKKWETLLDR